MKKILTSQNSDKSKESDVLILGGQKNLLEYLSGLGKRVWEGVDTDKYMKELKKEWHQKFY